MITSFDDYCIHQTAEPIAQPSQSDRNFYDRYWFGGIDTGGQFIFEAGFGLYPNRRVMDGHFSITLGSRQYSFHASRRAPKDRAETVVGPLRVQIVEPMRIVKLVVAPNDTGIECDLTFTARSVPLQEPKSVMYDDGHLIMHTTRFTQCGFWEGHVTVDGRRVEVRRETTLGTRDKSWGVRPVGEPQGGAPGLINNEPGVYWVWSPIHFPTFATQFGTFEDRDGLATQVSAHRVPFHNSLAEIPQGEDPGVLEYDHVSHKILWEKGTRRARGAHFEFATHKGDALVIDCEPLMRFQMTGVGYNHPEWGHAMWKGELVTAREDINHDELDPLAYQNIHLHQLVRARAGDMEGYGILETICVGRHTPSGFKSFFDPAE